MSESSKSPASKDWSKFSLFSGVQQMLQSSGGPAPTSNTTTSNSAERGERRDLSSDDSKEKDKEKAIEDISREDLMHLCMKLNKRMQSMETKLNEVTKTKKLLTLEKRQLIEILKSLVVVPIALGGEEAELDVSGLKDLVSQSEAKRNVKIMELENKILSLTEAHQAEIANIENRYRKELIGKGSRANNNNMQTCPDDSITFSAENATEEKGSNDVSSSEPGGGEPRQEDVNSLILLQDLERLTQEKQDLQREVAVLKVKSEDLETTLTGTRLALEEIRARLSSTEEALEQKSESFKELQSEKERSVSQLEEQVVYLQMQAQRSKASDEAKEREVSAIRRQLEVAGTQVSSLQLQLEEKNASISANREMIEALQSQVEKAVAELESVKERARDADRNMGAATLLKAEQEALLFTLRKDLRSALDAREEMSRKLEELEASKAKEDELLAKISDYEKAVNSMQNLIDDKSSMITRLRQESQTSERNHAMRTAMLATCEAQIESMKAELTLKEEAAKETLERVSILQARLSGSEARVEEVTKQSESEIHAMKLKMDETVAGHAAATAAMQAEHDSATDTARKEFAKKSQIARQLLSEREAECRDLQDKIQELQTEIASGAPNERRIFELAQSQARRDTLNGVHRDTRELAFQQLQGVLAARDLELARLQQGHSSLSAEVAELRRTSRREGVNMDYLKNIVLQFMKLPSAAPERASLVLVIATLLQFTKAELSQAESAVRSPTWTTLPVKEVKRSSSSVANQPSSSGSSSLSSSAVLASSPPRRAAATECIVQGDPNPEGGYSPLPLLDSSNVVVSAAVNS